MEYTCTIKDEPIQAVLAIRKRTNVDQLPAELGAAYGAIMAYLAELGEQPAGAPYAAYFNMDMQDLDVEMGFPVSHLLPGKEGIQSHTIFGEQVADCIHVGPYAAAVPAYEALGKEITTRGLQATGVAYEIYLNDPGVVPQEALQTRIVFPIKSTR